MAAQTGRTGYAEHWGCEENIWKNKERSHNHYNNRPLSHLLEKRCDTPGPAVEEVLCEKLNGFNMLGFIKWLSLSNIPSKTVDDSS